MYIAKKESANGTYTRKILNRLGKMDTIHTRVMPKQWLLTYPTKASSTRISHLWAGQEMPCITRDILLVNEKKKCVP